MGVVLQADGLTARAGERDLFQGLTFGVDAGVTLIQGGDGRGKTTLMRVLAGVLAPATGSVRLVDSGLTPAQAAYRQQVFWHEPHGDAVRDLRPHDIWHGLAQTVPLTTDDWTPLADTLGLTPHLDKPMYMLSTGSRRKVGLVAALSCQAPLVLIDSPFAGVDLASTRAFCQVLRERAAASGQAWVLADYAPPPDVSLVRVVDLGD